MWVQVPTVFALLLLSPLSLCVWGMCVCIDVSARARVYHTGLLCRGMINNNHNRIDQGGARWRRDGWFKMETDTYAKQ